MVIVNNLLQLPTAISSFQRGVTLTIHRWQQSLPWITTGLMHILQVSDFLNELKAWKSEAMVVAAEWYIGRLSPESLSPPERAWLSFAAACCTT